MKFCIILLLFTLNSIPLFPQKEEKYILYLTEKIIVPAQPESILSERAIARRKKLHDGVLILQKDDYPVNENSVRLIEKSGVRVKHRLRWLNAVSVFADTGQLHALSLLPCVKGIEKVHAMRVERSILCNPLLNFSDFTPPGTRHITLVSDEQLQFAAIDKVHALNIFGKDVLIGVLDSGFDLSHEAFQNLNVLSERDFVQGDTITAYQPGDAPGQDSHGTFVLSVLAGYKAGVFSGVASKVEVVLAKTENIASETHAEEDNFAAALEWMDSIGVDITTSSLGYNVFDKGQASYSYKDMDGKTTIVSRAVNTATAKGITVFNSAGNEGDNSWGKIIAPADAFDIISVGSVGKNNTVSSFSSKGPTYDGRIKPELVTLGEYVYGALAGMDTVYYYQFGTSAATPIAAGTGALTLSAYPFLTNVQLRNVLLQSAEQYPHANNAMGYGRLSAYRAITFPVIKQIAGETSVMKIALDSNARDFSMSLSHGDGMYVQVPCQKRGNINEFAIPDAYSNNRSDFYFTYSDSLGVVNREPGNGLYYTNDWVTINIVRQTTDEEFVTNWYPNPFHYKVFADISMAAAGNVDVKIYNITGELVFSRSSYMAIPGLYLFTWDGTNFSGNPVSSGVYVCGVEAGGKTGYKKIIRLK